MRRSHCRSTFLSLLAVLTIAPSLQAATTCGNRDFKGVYGMIARGNILAVPDPVFNPIIGPVIRVSRVVADGNGHVASTTDASYNGFVLAEDFAGTYRVNPDCTIRYDLMVPLPVIFGPGPNDWFGFTVPFVFVGALGDGGADIAVDLAFPPQATVRVHLQRQDNNDGHDSDERLTCSTGNLSGTYQLDMDGNVINQPPLPAGPFTRSGALTFDGNGGFSGTTFTNYNGFASPAPQVPAPTEVLTGTYSVNSSCKVNVSYSFAGSDYGWAGVLTNGGRGANLMVTSPAGAVIGGTLLKTHGGSSGR